MTQATVGHQVHAMFHRVFGSDRDDIGGHDLADGGSAGRALHQGYLARVVPLADDAAEFVALHDQQGSHAFFRHQSQGLDDHGGRGD